MVHYHLRKPSIQRPIKRWLDRLGEGDIRKAAPNIIDITLSSQQLFMNQLVKHRIKDNFVVIDENLTHSSAPYVGLDDATNEAKQILKGNASRSSKVALGNSEALEFLMK